MAGRLSADALRKRFNFRWDMLEIIIGGKSAIDALQGFRIQDKEDADRFIKGYGYDLQNPIEQGEAFGNFHESVNFIRRYFLKPDNPDGLKLEIPRKILELSDVRDLLLMGNFAYAGQGRDSGGTLLRDWACAILKVMHSVSHLDQDVRSNYFADIQKQILDRYYRVIHRDGQGRLYLGSTEEDPGRVDLVAFETKPKKSRDSMIIKLLHKTESSTEDIFDRVGIRFITPRRLDTLRVINFLKERMILTPPNVKASRSRNLLVDCSRLEAALEALIARVRKEGSIDEESALAELEEACLPPGNVPTGGAVENPHTSSFYRSIQFTTRQLIKLPNPIFDGLKELKAWARKAAARDTDPSQGELDGVLKIVEHMDLKYVQKEARFFFPYEVQLIDAQSHEENESGKSAHGAYKRAQLQTAMRRVMGPLMESAR